MPAAYAERARFDLSSTRAICLQFATCDRVLQRMRRRTKFGGQVAIQDSQTWQINSQQARVENVPESAARREGAKRGEAGRKDPHKSSWPHFCVRRSRLRETTPWFNKKIHTHILEIKLLAVDNSNILW